MPLQIYRPELFQGNLKLTNYFEGWYFKHVSEDLGQVWSFIPGISLTKEDPHCFIQIINGINGETEYITYPLDEFSWDSKRLHLRIGNSSFSENYIDLNIINDKFRVTGKIDYSDMVKYPKTLISPGIMGWYSFIPFMECKHAIVSVNHNLTGSLKINDFAVNFNDGKGYIEKDWGTSFPEAWLWIQANNFHDRNTSFNFSVAKIPWMGKFFIGFISFLCYNNRFFLFSTYDRSQLTEIKHSDGMVSVVMQNKYSILKIHVQKSTFGELRAPAAGNMSRKIKESIDSKVVLWLFDRKNNLIYNDSSERAGLEVIEKIFDYL